MATRSNILVMYGSTKLYVYRHWDGYPAENGADIYAALVAAEGNPTKFVSELLGKTESEARLDGAKRPHYEVTTDIHGDIEWLYSVKFESLGSRGGPLIGWASRKPGNDDGLRVPNPVQTIEQLLELVNNDRKLINYRIQQRKAENPGNKFYEDVSEYPMVPAPAVAAPAAGGVQ
jgi:hypothetical protein